jgi:hypothetical protein
MGLPQKGPPSSVSSLPGIQTEVTLHAAYRVLE